MSDIASATPSLIDILLIEDDPGDVLLTKEALRNGKVYNSFWVAEDGIDALEMLRGEGEKALSSKPDLILLDLNMPRMDGREFLSHIKADEVLRRIPVVVLTTSDAELDIIASYDLQASCYITKPVDLGEFTKVVTAIKEFWFAVVRFPGE